MSEPTNGVPGQPAPKGYFIHTYGCQMNEHDSERIAGSLVADGYVPVEREDLADVVVFNTCTIRENADNRLYGNLGMIRRLKESKPGLKVVVGGCQAQKDRDLIQQKAPWVDVVFGTHNVHHAADLIRRSYLEGPILEILEEAEMFPSALPVVRESEVSAWVTIQIGCDNACAFCIVPSVRGVEISRPFGELLAEVRTLAAAGTTEVTLLGQNVNSYGRDLTLANRPDATRGLADPAKSTYECGTAWLGDLRARPLFADLLKAVGSIEGIRRVRYTSPHPKDLRPETIEAMVSTPTVMPHLHLPLQSGSDRVLSAMHRGYTVERYLEKITAARAAIPNLAVTTDIIVGFPGETEAEFEQTLQLCAEVQFDNVFTYQFSSRPGTAAADMSDVFVDPDVISQRFARLKIVTDRTAEIRHHARIGCVEEVLVEGPSKRDPLVTSGRTAHYKLIHFPTPEGRKLEPGTYCAVKVVGSAAYFLRGELIEVTARHRQRVRIPVTSA
jgi:tRNA-2-methylthio-N6-dimethylallyladenosine synthase